MPNGLLSQILSGTAQQLLADGTPHDATGGGNLGAGGGNPGIAAIKTIASEIGHTLEHIPPAVDATIKTIASEISDAFAHLPPAVDATLKTIASEISDTFAHLPPAMDTHLDQTSVVHSGQLDFTSIDWSSFWDQMAQGDQHFSGEAFDPFAMFATHHSDWSLS
jgi:hypothetical protein